MYLAITAVFKLIQHFWTFGHVQINVCIPQPTLRQNLCKTLTRKKVTKKFCLLLQFSKINKEKIPQ
jgi:hypothetical protein